MTPRIVPAQHITLIPEPLTPSSFSSFGTAILSPLPQYLTSIHKAAPAPPSLYPPFQPQPVHANQDTALKTSPISPLTNNYPRSGPGPITPSKSAATVPEARGLMSIFSCFPRQNTYLDSQSGKMRLQVEILERHPLTTQTFCPFNFSLPMSSSSPSSPSSSFSSRTTVTARGSNSSLNASTAPPTYILIIVAPTINDATSVPSNPPDLSRARAFISPVVPDGGPGVAVTYAPGTWHAPMVVLGNRRVDFLVTQFVNGQPEDDCQEVLVGDLPSGSRGQDGQTAGEQEGRKKEKYEENRSTRTTPVPRRALEVDLKGLGLGTGSEIDDGPGLWKARL